MIHTLLRSTTAHLVAIIICSLTFMATANPPAALKLPLVGAIRWDAWHGTASSVGVTVEKTMAPSHWHYRLPFYGKVIDENSVEVRANTQAIMDQEIDYAHDAGLDYWAFVVYPEQDALSEGLHLYLSSSKKSNIKFCLNLQGGWESGGGMKGWQERLPRYLKYFQDTDYQCVLKDRPLLYLFTVDDLVGPAGFETWESARAAFDELREACAAAAIPNPYIVAQGWSPQTLKEQALKLGLDAIGAYASNGGAQGASYADLAAHTEKWWDEFKDTTLPVVPLATAGWDMRPRVETPVPWVEDGDIKQYYETPQPDELAAHLSHALAWCRQHPSNAQAQAILMYAWNEFDEGGWLCPTLSEGTARVDALRTVLKEEPAPEPDMP
ncbi:MAG: hypothetical protein GX117_13245 [Candidatus Hydrogenedentes bacterium]|nr:hypothetical protein [Candidatus Hydrogenedentota bacterium]